MTHTRRILATVLLAAGAAALAAPVANAGTTPGQDIALNTSDPTAQTSHGPDASDALNTAVTSLVGGLTS